MPGLSEADACALLKRRFEAAGFQIAENIPFEEGDIRFDIDGYDAAQRVGYEYLTSEAGDSWDVDGTVIAALEARRRKGELHVLVVDEADAPDAESLGAIADAFLRDLGVELGAREPAAANAAPPKPKAKPKATAKPAKPKAKPPAVKAASAGKSNGKKKA